GVVALSVYYDMSVRASLDLGIAYSEASASALHVAFLVLAGIALACLPLAWMLGRTGASLNMAIPSSSNGQPQTSLQGRTK
ncbi:hypothetical protein P8631_17790, partial [Guyparkeria sp. 1SP6A2]|nr:hypothetical protein [Guyparkeria sp. 1SP6A2]